MHMLSLRKLTRIPFDLWPKHVAHPIAGSHQDAAGRANALELAGRATGDHVEFTMLVGEPHGGRNGYAACAKGRQEPKLIGRQGGKRIIHLSLVLLALGSHVPFLTSCCLYFVKVIHDLVTAILPHFSIPP